VTKAVHRASCGYKSHIAAFILRYDCGPEIPGRLVYDDTPLACVFFYWCFMCHIFYYVDGKTISCWL